MGLRRSIRTAAAAVSQSLASPVETGFTIVDDIFPHPQSGFRLAEFNAYLDEFPESSVYTTGTGLPDLRETRPLAEVLDEYYQAHPTFKGRVQPTLRWRYLQPSLLYCVFINNADRVRPMAERAGCGLAFTLYPGGGLQLHDKICAEKLKRVFGSKSFRTVIVTQKTTRDYLLEGDFCSQERIKFIYGGVFQNHSSEKSGQLRRRFLESKPTFDVCFVAHKYMPQGRDKGYDVFVAVAKGLARVCPEARFHVVGPYSQDDIDVSELGERIFY